MTGGFVLGEVIALSAVSKRVVIPALFALAAILLCILATDRIRGTGSGFLLAALILAALGMVRGEAGRGRWEARSHLVKELEGSLITVCGTVESWEETKGGLELILCDNVTNPALKWDEWDGDRAAAPSLGNEKLPGAFKIPRLLVTLSVKEGDTRFLAGNKIAVLGKIKGFSQARNPGNFDYRSYYQAMGLDGRLYGEKAVCVEPSIWPLANLLLTLKKKGKDNILAVSEEKDAGIFCAAVLGDKRALDPEIKDLYQKNGIAHLLAISGLHLSILGMGLYRLLRRAGWGYKSAGCAAACFLLCYGMLTGASPSVMRAMVMMLAVFAAASIGRTYDLLSAASLALFLLALGSPLLLFQAGVWLSYGAVFAIGGAVPFFEKLLGKGKMFSVSLAIQLFTLPAVLYHFYQVPLYGLFLNLAVVPLMGTVVCSGLAAAVLGGIFPALGILATGPGHYVLWFYERLLSLASALPWSNVIMGRPGIATIASYYLCLAGGLSLLKWRYVLWEEELQRQPEEPSGKALREPSIHRISLLFGLLVLCAVCARLLVPAPPDGMEVLFLDVGQGDGILIHTDQAAVLVDGGSTSDKKVGKNRLEPCVKSLGISKIDIIYISHGDRDHLSGAAYLLEACPEIGVGCLVLPYHGREDKEVERLSQLALSREIPVLYGKAGDVKVLGELAITCLYPGTEDIPSDTNEESLVLRMDYKNCHLLFTGDMSGAGEEALLKQMEREGAALGQVQILKTAHHGSKYSTTDSFLDIVSPRWAVISYEEGNSYGHPHKETIERLQKRNIHVLETAKGGAVIFRTDGEAVRISYYLGIP